MTRSSGKTRLRAADDATEERGAEASIRPPQRRSSGGNSGYAGYEYQVQATVWIALVLLVAKSASDNISIETKTDEDIEAAIDEPDGASLGISAATLNLIFQIKSRSTAPWGASGFAAVLTGDLSLQEGSQRRKRPLDLLLTQPRSRYLLITNESLNAGLRPLQIDSLIEAPQQAALPAAARKDLSASEQLSLSGRIAMVPGMTHELLDSKVRILLSMHCHVPASKQDACIRDLSDQVRLHMTGKLGGVFSKKALLAVCAVHGGSLLPTRAMDHYVKPKNYDAILQMLDRQYAVIIAGPSGNGKSLTADFIEHRLRTSTPPYSVVHAELGPSSIRSELQRADSVLFHLRDPWGSNRISPQAESWSSELPKLLPQANAGHKFLITSRSDVMSGAMHETIKKLKAYVIPIELEDYGPKRLEQIYDGISSDLPEYPAQLARQYRAKALQSLSRPYEIDRFLVTLRQEDPSLPRSLDDLLIDSQIEAISTVVSDQVSNLGEQSLTAATILWAVLKAREAVTRDALMELARRVRRADPTLRSDMDGLIEFLTVGKNLRDERNTISFYHPRVEDGLRLAIYRRPDDAEAVLSRLIDSLVAQEVPEDNWGAETALGILRAANTEDGIKLAPSREARGQIDAFLTQSFFSAKKTHDSARTLDELAKFGSGLHPFTQLAKILTSVDKRTRDKVFGNTWKQSPMPEKALVHLQEDSRTSEFLARFIEDVLPFSRIRYGRQLGPLLNSLCAGLDAPYRKAIQIIASPGGPNENMDVIIEGACAADNTDFDWLIEQFVKADAEASTWFETFQPKYRQAEEHEVDAAYADHLFEEPGEQFYNPQAGLKKIALIRAKRQGTQWLEMHPHREMLVDALASAIDEQVSHQIPSGRSLNVLPVDNLQHLLALSGLPGRLSVWRAIGKCWDESFRASLMQAIAFDTIQSEDLRELLLITLFEHTENPIAALRNILPTMTLPRRFEVLIDIMTTSLPDEARGPKQERVAQRLVHARSLISELTASESSVATALVSALSGTNIMDSVALLTAQDRDVVRELLETAQTSTTKYLASLAVAVRMDAFTAIDRLLTTGDANEGENAVLALGLRATKSNRAQLLDALTHPRYHVRQEAMNRVLPAIAEEERSSMLFLAEDKSADVRLTWAEMMSDLRWPEAIPSLIHLLADTRNFNSDPGFSTGSSWAIHSVARAAAKALGNYENLPSTAIDALLGAVEHDNADPFVICAALSALSDKDDPRIGAVLANSLEAPGLEDSPDHRPVAQAAAWAIFDRAIARKGIQYEPHVEKAIVGHSSLIAGPVLMALALAAHSELGAIEEKLNQKNFVFRKELLHVANAVFHGNVARDAVYPISDLARLASDPTGERPDGDLEKWSRSLKGNRDVQRFTAWLVQKGCKLPTAEDVGDPREYDLPERIGFMSMRSLTPFREVNDRALDKGI
jgi:hypothetical protein